MASEIKVNTIKDLGGNTIVSSNGSGTISGLPASAISSGTVATARLGSGTASSSTFLAGDQSYKTVSGTTINNNADNRLITGSGTANTLEGEANLSFTGSQLKIGGQTSAGTAGYAGQLQLNGVNDNVALGINSFKNNDGGTSLVLGKSRNANAGSFTVLQNNDVIGAIRFAGDDGNDYESQGASIDVRVDGTAGSNDMPCRMIFSTTPDGAASPVEAMRINNAGIVTKAKQPTFLVNVNGDSVHPNLPTGVTIMNFGSEAFDIGSNVSSVGVFTAPVTGKYQFNTSIGFAGITTSTRLLEIFIKASNREMRGCLQNITGLFSSNSNDIQSFGFSTIIDMDTNDTCFVQVAVTNGGGVIDVIGGATSAPLSFFSGNLLA